MRLALKLTMVITALTVIVLVLQAQLRLARELDLLEASIRTDQHLIGATILPTVAEALDVGGMPAAKAVIARADESERAVRLRLVDLRDEAPAADRPDIRDPEVISTVRSHREVVAHRSKEHQSAALLYTYLPVTDDDHGVAIELMKSLRSLDEFSARAYRDLLFNILIVGGFSVAFSIVIGWSLIGRRVEQLVGMARAVGRGEYPEAPHFRQSDELSSLAAELTAMVELLRRSDAQLEQEARRRESAVAELRHADRLATIGTLMANVAHDVGTPLNVISARAKMIARGTVEGDAILTNAKVVAEQADRVASTIRRFLDYARRSVGERAAGSIQRIAEDARSLVESFAQERGVELRVQVEHGDTVVHCDPQQVLQALANILINGIQVSGRGSPVTIQANVREDAGERYAVFEIIDQGPGMSDEVLARATEAFFSTKGAGEGTGLGLAIAEGIARDHNGRLKIARVPSGGASVAIWLPLVVAPVREIDRASGGGSSNAASSGTRPSLADRAQSRSGQPMNPLSEAVEATRPSAAQGSRDSERERGP